MITRTYYFPRDAYGRDVINHVVSRISCSVGDIHVVADTIAVSFTMPAREEAAIVKILRCYDLLD